MLNDFEANGYGVTAVNDENLVTLNDVPAKPKARLASPCCECIARLGCPRLSRNCFADLQADVTHFRT